VGDFRFKEVELGINKCNSGKYSENSSRKSIGGCSVPCIIYSLELKHFGIEKIIAVMWRRKYASGELNFSCCLCWTSQFINYNFGILSNK
jgi:hypothetical protein